MSDRLLQRLQAVDQADATVLLTPDLADTLESLEETLVRGRGDAPALAHPSGWKAGMEVTPGVVLVRLLADGGMGSVWVADHAKLQIRVAVKLVSVALLEKQPSLVERLDREAAALGRLANPNIVEIFDHGTTADGTPFIVMELLEGATLWQLVKRHGPLSVMEVAAILEQVAHGLSAAHSRGIIHRDIKPQNIFVFARDGRIAVKVIDFGIAKEMEVNSISSVTKTGTLLGTPHFMSPEQLLTPRTVDARTDLWSMGVVGYHALTREFPFDGETLAGLFAGITAAQFTPLSTRVPHLGPEMDGWMNKAMARDPQRRFGTARELATALKRVAVAMDSTIAHQRAPKPTKTSKRRAQVSARPPAVSGSNVKAQARAPIPSAPPHSGPRPSGTRPGDGGRSSRPPISGEVAVSAAATHAPSGEVRRPSAAPPEHDASEPPPRKLLPYPFALMQEEEPAPLSTQHDRGEDAEQRQRRVIVVGGIAIAVVLLLFLLMAR